MRAGAGRTRIWVLGTLFLLGGVCLAEDLGNYGRAYPIKERDAIDTMKDAAAKKLANGGKERGDALCRMTITVSVLARKPAT